jgi:hypothetical protein
MRAIAAASRVPNRIDIFWLNTDLSMRHMTWNGSSWSFPPSFNLGGVFTSVPAATASLGNPQPATQPGAVGLRSRIDVFGLGTDFAMYHKAIFNEAAPAQWEDLGGIFTSAPFAIAWNNGRVDVFGLGLDRAMYQKTWDGTSWTPDWERLGAAFSSEVFAVSWGNDRLDVFARGVDFSLRHRTFNGSKWLTDWQNLGGSLASPPVAVSWGPNRLDVFAIGTDGQVWHRWWDGEIWNDWESLPLPPGTPAFIAPPAATAGSPDRLDVFAVGADFAVRHLSWTNGSWNAWEDLGGSMTSGPTAIMTAANQLDVFAPGNDKSLYHRVWNGTTWQPANWEELTAPVKLPARFRFSVDFVTAESTRSLISDTDYSQCSVRAGNWSTRTATQYIGNLGGTSTSQTQTNLLFLDPVDLDYCEPVIFNYSVVNNGNNSESTVTSFITKSAEELIEKISGIDGPLVDFLLDDFFGIIFADCDGWVVVDQHQYLGRDVDLMTSSGPLTQTQTYPGYDSPTGCGGNSKYQVVWSIHRSTL